MMTPDQSEILFCGGGSDHAETNCWKLDGNQWKWHSDQDFTPEVEMVVTMPDAGYMIGDGSWMDGYDHSKVMRYIKHHSL